jgi:Mlc titration factor MtfA (ptsG expression regulator)
MTGVWIVLAVVAVAALVAGLHGLTRRRRRRRLMAVRLTAGQREQLGELFPLWRRVPAEIRGRVEALMPVFLGEKNLEACGGLEQITDEMRLAIAAPACLLVANRSIDDYHLLHSVLVYPDAFVVRDEWGVEDVRLGESWGAGSVVLAWKSVLAGDRNPEDGLNVVLHEFAHQLDQADGAGDGVPELDEAEDYGRWSAAFQPAFEEFREVVRKGQPSVLDEYGATNAAEFFAVATETFFERAEKLKFEEPELYQELRRFYGMDPAAWG